MKVQHLACTTALLLISYLLAGCNRAAAATHFVDVGLNFSEFTDRDSGAVSSFNLPASSFIRVGDTVVWVFHGQHSTTSGSCFNFSCQANGTWDSKLQNAGAVFSQTFDTAGVFPYFCSLHSFFGQGQVVVLTQPDFEMRLTNSFNPGPPSLTSWAGNSVGFTGTLFSRAGFTSLVTLSCANGSPRLPTRCPSGPVSVVPTAPGTPFIFPVGDDSAGAFTFNIVATGADPASTTHSGAVTLNLLDYALSALSPNSVLVFAQGASFPMTFQVTVQNPSQFGISINLECNGLPEGVNCVFIHNGFITNGIFVSPGTPEDVGLTLTVSLAAPPGLYNATVKAQSTLFLNTIATAVRSRPFSAKVIGRVTHFDLNPPATTLPGVTFPLTVTARDAANNAVLNYGGTVHFSSSDPAAILPVDYTFMTTPIPENGTHVFGGVALKTIGPRVITVSDLSTGVSTTSGIIFVGNLNPNTSMTITASSQPAFFKHSSITFGVTVTGIGPTPTGIVRFFEGITELGMAVLAPTGAGKASASFSTDRLRIGDHSVLAVYEGDSNFGTNFSSAVTKTRSPAPHCVGNICPGTH